VSQLIPPLIPPLIPLLMCHRGSPCFPAVIIETPVHAFAASSPNRVGRAAASYSEFIWETVLWVSDCQWAREAAFAPITGQPAAGNRGGRRVRARRTGGRRGWSGGWSRSGSPVLHCPLGSAMS